MQLKEQIAFLEELFDLDQAPRIEYMQAITEEQKQLAGRKMGEADEKNLPIFLDYLDRYGWPSLTLHGQKAAGTAFYIIQHSTVELMETYFPILKEKAQQNEASKVHAGMMEDRILSYKMQPQIYGSQAQSIGDKGLFMWPVKNPEIVNSLRQQMGFKDTIEENAARLEAVYDPTLKIEDFL